MSIYSDKVERFETTVVLDVQSLARVVVALADAREPILAVRMVKDALSCGLRQGKDIIDVARLAPRSYSRTSVVLLVAEAIERYMGE